MYLIKRLLALLVIVSVVFTLLFFGRHFFVWLDSAEHIGASTGEETRSNVQWLSSDKPLRFNFSNQRTHSLRILSNAVFDNSISFDQPVNYAIKYVLYDQQERVILDDVYHHASKLYTDLDGQKVKQIIENKQSLSVASGQSFYLPIAHYPHATSLELTMIPEQANLQGVVVRVHAKTPEQSIDPLNTWLKRPLDRRQRATNYLTLGENALTSNEISNAMAYWWQKIAPQGIPDIDFKSDILYESLPYNVLTYDFSAEQHDLGAYFTEEGLCASVRLDEPDSLIFTVKEGAKLPHLIWYDKLQFSAPTPVSFAPTDIENRYQTQLIAAGLVSICSDEAILTQWQTLSDTPILTSYAGSYLINELGNVEFDIDPKSDLKLDVRALETSQLEVVLFDQTHTEIERYSLAHKGDVSHYDRLIDDTTQRQRVGLLTSYYLRTPANAYRVQIKANKDTYVQLRARYAQFHYQRVVAHQNITTPIDQFYDIAAWYELRANNHFELTQQARFANIRTFTPPAEVEPMTTFYQPRELYTLLPISNVALALSPDRYFIPKQPAQIFNFGLYTPKTPASYSDTGDNKLIFKLSNTRAQERNASDVSATELKQLQNKATATYQNWHGERPWIKQRLYQLNKNTPLILNFDAQEQPMSVVFKLFRSRSAQPIEFNILEKANYKSGLTSEYSIAKQRVQLHSSELLNAFLIHPKNSQLNSYPSVTHTVSSDINKLHSLTISASETVWLSILQEYPLGEQKVRWWNNEY
ncbi:hypothetical protein D0907_11150 [Pseudoalteromonas lipolytica]|uniref:Uncharacterized protein n=1 Tax=Pseudoalteromonas lipolytica TaxID=570156 RepID=A0AAD0S098_9GAMM|nr:MULTISPECIES: hypothetical protein [Pseudoalteromonas]AXV65779.1 hypothetical protein D0907_11150 [Pseudoalteromonas donghaensis]